MHIPEDQTLRPESCKCKCTSSLDSSCWGTFWSCSSPPAKCTARSENQAGRGQSMKQQTLSRTTTKIIKILQESPRLVARWLTSPRLWTVRPPRTIGKMGLPKKSKQKRHLKTIRVAFSSVSRDQQCIAWKLFILFHFTLFFGLKAVITASCNM